MTSSLCLTYNSGTAPSDLISLRSLLFAPGADERKLRRAADCGADAVIADLEDSVPASGKAPARANVAQVFHEPRGAAARLIRLNGVGTPWFAADLALAEELRPDAIVLPKATPEALDAVAGAGLPILAIVETAVGVRLAYEVACHPDVFALLIGAVDLAAELGLEPRADALEIHYVRSKVVIDSAAAGARPPFDVVHVAVDDSEGLAAQARLARSLGLRGKACIHPAQVAVVNEAFTPDAASVDWARRVIAAADAAAADGSGATTVDDAMVDAPVVARARRLLDESERSQAT